VAKLKDKPARKTPKKKKPVRFLTAAALFGFAGSALLLTWFCYDMPGLADVKPLDIKPGIAILANDGTQIARYGGMKGETVLLHDMPRYLPQAVLAIEDRRFYSHPGIDVLGLARAMWVNVQAGHWAQGGSTLTQQLAKNMFLTSNKTLRRKVQEALMALEIEHKFTKEEILEAYLNRVYFGAGAYGIEAAAKTYFGKHTAQLDLWESAMLAGLLKAPSRFSPAANPVLARDRAKTVVKAMGAAGYITPSVEKSTLKSAKIVHVSGSSGGMNRYFADWVVNQIDSFIGGPDGFDGNIVVRTTFDPKLQSLAESNATRFFKQLKPEDKISQMALVTLGKGGAVLAMIGGTDYATSQFNRATQAQRQPGSTFKPFVYLAALEAGYSPSDKILDAPFISGTYRPDNYENQYLGMVTLTEALTKSLNTATVRLLNTVGISRMLDVAMRAGFSEKFRPELATGLGADEVNLLELVNAYGVIANGGRGAWSYAITSIEDAKGNSLYQREIPDYVQEFSPRNTADLDHMLEQVVAQGTGQAAQLSQGHVAGKTGTTQNYRDAWFVGYTDKMVTGIWMGNDDASPMNRVSGGRYPARLWHDYMNAAMDVAAPALHSSDAGAGDSDDFSTMLQRWSIGGNTQNARENPVYNP
jgi:penicillin-binding protein 1A